ncbi:hypothetical protein L226DRAFT_607814 [Lentinus tigrinus ALCF2SS1-7]|uniref:G-protein coupled receptors family 1 profile domain-containing protein n=1 Tax=Lentinus tigrinus ALCF2SS1-6 TaxID=1328759 RepID=A0A5C2SMB4_9APHY|nr:hypothetical protein L227DRAFT_607386 [Lentinus tigrinus ALCF2SS1-6]RPD82744.1 hypothetical protein L226DRAFT_607814 [Lentinus tigrinus ALCF2SS1-7]
MSPQPGVYYGPDEDEYTKNLERFFVAGDFVCGVGYGIMLVLWTSCVRYLWNQRRRSPKTTLLLIYLCLLFVVETIFCIVQARTVQVIYIENRNYPGGPWQYFLDTQYLAINVMFYATLFIITFLCDLLVLWRCWVVWTASGPAIAYSVIALPSVMLLASFVMGTLWTLQSSQPNLSMYSAEPLAFGTAYYTLSLGLNIILTILITLRLMIYRRTHLVHLPPQHARQYLSLATVIVESAALYSAFAIAFLVSYAMNQPINQIWLGFAQAAQQISTYLIIHRVAMGTAWTSNAMESQTLTSFNAAPRAQGTGERDLKRTGPSNVQFTSQFSVSEIVAESKSDSEEEIASAV